MDPVRVGVIGVGYLGQHHARVYSELPGVELVGVVDINKERAKEVAERYFTSAFFDYQDLFGKVDAVSIVVPTVIHRDIAGRFIEQGINILIEKPVTTSLEEARELMEMANKKNVVLQVGHIERFNSAVVELSKIVDHPIFIDCSRMGPYVNRNTDVGVVLDLMIHDIDTVSYTHLDVYKRQDISCSSGPRVFRFSSYGGWGEGWNLSLIHISPAQL